MIIKVETQTEEDLSKVIHYVERFLIENFNSFKFYIDDKLITEMGTDGKVKREKK